MKQIIKDINFEENENVVLEVSKYKENCRDVLVWADGQTICLLTSDSFESQVYSWRCLFDHFVEGYGYSGPKDGFGDIKEAINFALNTSESEVYVVSSISELAELLDELY